MIDIVVSCVAVLLTIATWKLCVVPSLRGAAEDTLWLLDREVARFMAADSKRQWESALAELRKLLAAQQQVLSNLSVLNFVSYSRYRARDPELFEELDRRMNERLRTNDEDVAKFIASVRRRASETQFTFMATQYFWVWVAAILAVPCIVVKRGVSVFGSVALVFASKLFSCVTGEWDVDKKTVVMRNTIEEISLRQLTV